MYTQKRKCGIQNHACFVSIIYDWNNDLFIIDKCFVMKLKPANRQKEGWNIIGNKSRDK